MTNFTCDADHRGAQDLKKRNRINHAVTPKHENHLSFYFRTLTKAKCNIREDVWSVLLEIYRAVRTKLEHAMLCLGNEIKNSHDIASLGMSLAGKPCDSKYGLTASHFNPACTMFVATLRIRTTHNIGSIPLIILPVDNTRGTLTK